MIDLSVVVVTWKTPVLTYACLAQLERALTAVGRRRDWSSEVVVVDNASEDGTAEGIRQRFPDVNLVVNEKNLGFAAGVNRGLEHVSGRFVLLLNSDAWIGAATIEGCLDALAALPSAGMAGPRLLHPDGRSQRSIHRFPAVWDELVPAFARKTGSLRIRGDESLVASQPVSVDAVRGAVLFVRRELIEKVGPLAEEYFFFMEETDWCWRAREQGWKVLFVPHAPALHVLGHSSKRRDAVRTRIEFQRSLDHFLQKYRGSGSARAGRWLRVGRGLLSGLVGLPAALFSRRARLRVLERWRVLAWQLRGRPARSGLEGWSGPGSV